VRAQESRHCGTLVSMAASVGQGRAGRAPTRGRRSPCACTNPETRGRHRRDAANDPMRAGCEGVRRAATSQLPNTNISKLLDSLSQCALGGRGRIFDAVGWRSFKSLASSDRNGRAVLGLAKGPSVIDTRPFRTRDRGGGARGWSLGGDAPGPVRSLTTNWRTRCRGPVRSSLVRGRPGTGLHGSP